MQKPLTCKSCPLYDISNSFSHSTGTGKNGVAIIGEALDYEGGLEGVPFPPKGQGGSKLQQCIDLAGYRREDFLLWNLIACNPPEGRVAGEWYADRAIGHCQQYFKQVVDQHQGSGIGGEGVKVILALGNTAFQHLTGEFHNVADIRGYPFQYKRWGKVVPGKENVVVIGTNHPNFIKKGNSQLTPLLIEDLQKAVEYTKGKFVSAVEYNKKKNYRIVGFDDANSFYLRLKDSPKLVIAKDIETADSPDVAEDSREDIFSESVEVTQIQYATDKYNAIIFPRFEGEYYKLAKKIDALPNLVLGFNYYNFDGPILKNKGMVFDESKIHDLMWMFKHWQPKLPRGLQNVASFAGFPFPWKHLFGSDMELYGGADVCSLHFILEWLPKLMQARGVWEGYKKFIFRLHPILTLAAEKGIPVNDEKRLELKVKLVGMRDGIDKELQEKIPDEIKNIEPKRKLRVRDTETGIEQDFYDFGFKRTPRDVIEGTTDYAKAITKFTSTYPERTPISFEQYITKKYSLALRNVTSFDSQTGEEIKVERWCRIKPFKASFDQLSRYIRYQREKLAKSTDKEEKRLSKFYEVPQDHSGKETTRKGEIEQLFEKTGDEVLQMNLEIRSISTNINNYIPNWKPGVDGNVHTTWGYSAASGQLDARRPNILNCSKHTDIGKLFRRIVEAPKGYSFVEFDKKSFHVATMGYRANDASYIRFSQLDPHSIFTSYIMPKEWGKPIDLSLSDEDILDRCKWIKKKCKQEKEKLGDRGIDLRQQTAKPCVLGNQLGLGPKKLYWQNRKSITSAAYAKELQDTLDEIFPKVRQAKSDIKQQAHKKTYLMNEFGYIQHFFEVFSYRWDKKRNSNFGGWVEQEQDEARDALAFAVQSPAFGMIKTELYRILDRFKGIEDIDLGYFPFRITIHDSLGFLFRDEHLERLIPICLEEMNKPCIELTNEATGKGGLKVGVEYGIGRNWAPWDVVMNPEGVKER